jgi:hypothetical protein
MSPTPHLSHRTAVAADLAEIVGFAQSAEELFFCFPKANWPLSIGQLAAAMAERRDSTVVLLEGRIAGFANFYQWHYDDHCAGLLLYPKLGYAPVGIVERRDPQGQRVALVQFSKPL